MTWLVKASREEVRPVKPTFGEQNTTTGRILLSLTMQRMHQLNPSYPDPYHQVPPQANGSFLTKVHALRVSNNNFSDGQTPLTRSPQVNTLPLPSSIATLSNYHMAPAVSYMPQPQYYYMPSPRLIHHRNPYLPWPMAPLSHPAPAVQSYPLYIRPQEYQEWQSMPSPMKRKREREEQPQRQQATAKIPVTKRRKTDHGLGMTIQRRAENKASTSKISVFDAIQNEYLSIVEGFIRYEDVKKQPGGSGNTKPLERHMVQVKLAPILKLKKLPVIEENALKIITNLSLRCSLLGEHDMVFLCDLATTKLKDDKHLERGLHFSKLDKDHLTIDVTFSNLCVTHTSHNNKQRLFVSFSLVDSDTDTTLTTIRSARFETITRRGIEKQKQKQKSRPTPHMEQSMNRSDFALAVEETAISALASLANSRNGAAGKQSIEQVNNGTFMEKELSTIKLLDVQN